MLTRLDHVSPPDLGHDIRRSELHVWTQLCGVWLSLETTSHQKLALEDISISKRTLCFRQSLDLFRDGDDTNSIDTASSYHSPTEHSQGIPCDTEQRGRDGHALEDCSVGFQRTDANKRNPGQLAGLSLSRPVLCFLRVGSLDPHSIDVRTMRYEVPGRKNPNNSHCQSGAVLQL